MSRVFRARCIGITTIVAAFLFLFEAPLVAQFNYIEHAGSFLWSIESGSTVKTIEQGVSFIWKPRYPNGALGYNIAFGCSRERNNKGKVQLKNVILTGMDTGATLEIPGRKAKWKDHGVFELVENSLRPQQLAGESAVLVTGDFILEKKFKSDELVFCLLKLVEGNR